MIQNPLTNTQNIDSQIEELNTDIQSINSSISEIKSDITSLQNSQQNIRIQTGIFSKTWNGWSNYSVTFPTRYSSAPLVSIYQNTGYRSTENIAVSSVSTTGFSGSVYASQNGTQSYLWMAIGFV